MTLAFALLGAMMLDAMLGEPDWLWSRVPHPAVLMGRAVRWLDHAWNTPTATKAKGIAALVVLVTLAGGVGVLLSYLGIIAQLVICAILLAQRSLVDHVGAVAAGLRMSPSAGRRAVAMIVSRDVTQSDTSATTRSAIESLSENFSDGVIAPAFWFLVGGLPGILIYKVVNTADSMIGYRTPRHAAFGWASARADDVLNVIPARLSAGLIAVVGGALAHRRAIARDAALHRSPNAGWPEAAMAHTLNIALAGPRSYDGQLTDLAWVNADGRRDLAPHDIDAAIAVIWNTWALALAGLCILGGLIWLF